MKAKQKVLVAHSDQRESTKIGDVLKKWGFEVRMAQNVNEALGRVQHKMDEVVPDVVLLCKDSVKTDKGSLIKSLRKTMPAPIIVFSVKKDEASIVEALDSGAYDYLVMPFGTAEHKARINAAIRNSAIRRVRSEVFKLDGLSIDFESREIRVGKKIVKLTPIEFRIITLLAKNAGKVLTHGELINEVWGPYNSDNLVLRVNMANIRKKIEETPSEPKFLFTETGIGYRMISQKQSASQQEQS